MVQFKKFLFTENCFLMESQGTAKQMETHLTHLEDLAIERGKSGFNDFVSTVSLFVQKIQGQESELDINAKIDGSPALLFGADPREEYKDQFFIALKYAVDAERGIIKEGAKLLHSEKEIKQFYGDRPEFATKLSNLLKELNRAYDRSGLIYQCDVLFSQPRDKSRQSIDGEDYILFKPNVIVYAIPADPASPLYNHVNSSEVGIVVHDSFSATPKDNYIILKQKTRKVKSIVESGKKANVFIMGANFGQVDVKIDNKFTGKINTLLGECNQLVQQISDEFDSTYVNSQIMEYLKIYINKQVDLPEGGIFGKLFGPSDIQKFINGFTKFLENRFDVIISKKKTEKGRSGQVEKLNSLLTYITTNADSMSSLLTLFSKMIQIKKLLMSVVERLTYDLRKAFFESPDGSLVATKGEGHVIFNGDTHVKIVDRLEFTKVNRARGGKRS